MEVLCFTENEQQVRQLIHTYFVNGIEQGLDVISWLRCQINCSETDLENILSSCCRKIIPPNYREYLSSEHWRKISTLAKGLANHRCQMCGKVGEIHTHHKTYERLCMERLSDLIVVCKLCHKKSHNK